jgi:dTDP-4-dehydrorhamnose 3,5-epimerase
MIDGVIVTPLRRIPNPKGDVYHALKRSDPGYRDFGEAYFSTVVPGAVKAWKRHRRMTVNVVVPVGAIKFAIVDDRPGSATPGAVFETVLGPDHYARLTIAPGLWFGFMGVGPGLNLLLNLADIEHTPDEGEQRPVEAFDYRWAAV